MTDENKKDRPDWYDETKLVSAIFAFEDGVGSYGGWVVDLGDGTCRLANKPLLGAAELDWGDRVDLFYNPCDPYSRPWIGYRRYREGEDPNGEQRGVARTPTAEQTESQERAVAAREARESKWMEERGAMLDAQLNAAETTMALARVVELASAAGVKIPSLKELLPGRSRFDTGRLSESAKTGMLMLAEHGRKQWGGLDPDPDDISRDINAACDAIEAALAPNMPGRHAMREEPKP